MSYRLYQYFRFHWRWLLKSLSNLVLRITFEEARITDINIYFNQTYMIIPFGVFNLTVSCISFFLIHVHLWQFLLGYYFYFCVYEIGLSLFYFIFKLATNVFNSKLTIWNNCLIPSWMRKKLYVCVIRKLRVCPIKVSRTLQLLCKSFT